MSALGRHIVSLDLFTDAYRVSGRTHVATSGLLSELNSPNSDFLDLEEAYISRIHEPGKIVASYSEVSFRKSNINFVVLQDRRDGAITAATQSRSLAVRARPIQVFLTIPSFEISGSVMHDGQTAPATILVHTLGNFQAILDAEARAALFPHVTYRGDLILVQKEFVGIFCLAHHKE